MKRPPRLVVALLAPFLMVWSAYAVAQNCTNGNNKYHLKQGGIDVSCSQSSCHDSDPKANMNNIVTGGSYAGGGDQAGNIQQALDSVPDMAGLQSGLGLTSSDLSDIALYIWYREGNQGCPAAAPSVSANPTSADFGNVNVGSSSAQQVITLTNSGSANATSMTYPAAPTHFTYTKTCGATINAGASCTITFTFSPTAAGTFTPTYTITGSGSTSVPIALSGTGVAASAPNVSASPSSLAFGTVAVGSTSGSQTITVSNTGTAAATNMSYPLAPPKFNKGGTCAGATLNAGASCTVTFTYSPTSATTDNPTYTITGGGATMPISLSGTGMAPQPASLQAAPTSLSFGNVTLGSASAPQSITISNSGGSSAAGVAITNSNAARFTVSGNTCGATIAAGGSCSLNVSYSPSAATTDNANLTINYQGGTPVLVAISGTGTSAPAPSLGASPGSLAFGNVTAGTTSAAKAVTVSNTGSAQASGISFASSNAAEFVVSGNTCGATLNAGATCTLNVAYAPSAAGADSATLTISYTGGSNVVVALSGTGTAAATPNLSASPPLAAFGNVNVGQTSAATAITINNTGGAQATGIALSNSNGAEFPVSGNTCGTTLSAGASCTLNVAYAPSAAGADSATLTINYAGGGAISISLTGTGVGSNPPPGTGQLSMPAGVTMADQTLGTSGAPHAVTLSNIGSAAVAVASIASSNAGEFAVSGSTCATVAAGASCAFNITFSPSATGGRSANITVTSNGAASPQAILISGNGLSSGSPPPATTADAIEYYHHDFDHYFITAIADEITKLDNGTFVGWARTGRSFKVYPDAASGRNGVCRFFSTTFAPKSSHFYTPDAPECATVKSNPNWMFEAVVFYVPMPTFDGTCPAGTSPVYRVYNNGQGGAPNHRYTADLAVRDAMLALGWIPEGYGTIGVIMCSPQ